MEEPRADDQTDARGPRVFIQIPCLNEAETLPAVLRDLPRELPGVARVEWLIIDDGSTDRTVEVAREHGVDHVVRLGTNRGLASAFLAGLDACVKLGADAIVNTDGDNQYRGEDVAELVAPLVERRADMAVGDRQVRDNPRFSPTIKVLQRFGSWVVRRVSTTDVADAPSGFRAMTRRVAQRIALHNRFSYTLETIIQAGAAGWTLESVPIRTNPQTRESRLFKSVGAYLKKNVSIIVRIYTMYRPLRAFILLSLPFFLIGVGLVARWLYFFFTTTGPTGHVQSLIAAAIGTIVGVQILLFGFLGDLLATNRRLAEESLYRTRELERVLVHGAPVEPPAESRPDRDAAGGAGRDAAGGAGRDAAGGAGRDAAG